MSKHKHADTIKAWADGAIIEYFDKFDKRWKDCANNQPLWYESVEYRVKVEEKKPVVRWMWSMKLTAFRGCDDTNWHCLPNFYTEEEINKKYPSAELVKLDWSKTEFPD